MGEGRGGGDLSFFLKVHVVCLAVLMDLPKIPTTPPPTITTHHVSLITTRQRPCPYLEPKVVSMDSYFLLSKF